MPKDPSSRIANYTYKINGQRQMEDVVALKPTMVAKESVAIQFQYDVQVRVENLLGTEKAVATCDYAKYLAFASEVAHVQQKFGGGTAVVNETAILIAKWKARNCTEAVLDRIRDEIFSIPTPTLP